MPDTDGKLLLDEDGREMLNDDGTEACPECCDDGTVDPPPTCPCEPLPASLALTILGSAIPSGCHDDFINGAGETITSAGAGDFDGTYTLLPNPIRPCCYSALLTGPVLEIRSPDCSGPPYATIDTFEIRVCLTGGGYALWIFGLDHYVGGDPDNPVASHYLTTDLGEESVQLWGISRALSTDALSNGPQNVDGDCPVDETFSVPFPNVQENAKIVVGGYTIGTTGTAVLTL